MLEDDLFHLGRYSCFLFDSIDSAVQTLRSTSVDEKVKRDISRNYVANCRLHMRIFLRSAEPFKGLAVVIEYTQFLKDKLAEFEGLTEEYK